jgi:hypothetical protein
MFLTIKEVGKKGESAHLQKLLVPRRFYGKGGVGLKAIFHLLVHLAMPAFEAVRTDHKVDQSQAHIPAIPQCPCVGPLDLPDPIDLHLNGSGGADVFTGPAGQTLFRIDFKGRSNLLPGSPVREPDGIGPYDLMAGANTKTAEDAIAFRIFSLERNLLDAQSPGEILDEWNVRASCQEKLGQNSPCLNHSLRMSLYVDPFPGRIVAGCHHSGLSVFGYLHSAKPAGTMRRKIRMVAERRNRDGHLLADFQKSRPFVRFYFFAVNG